MKQQKRVFNTILSFLAIFLLIIPFLITFNEALTRIVENFRLYKIFQDSIVPLEIRMIKILTIPFGVDFAAFQNGLSVNGVFVELSWNCIGWQSALLVLITLFVGLRSGAYTMLSSLEAIAIAFLGTFLINLIRLTFLVMLFFYSQPFYAILYHNFFAAFVTVVWLFIFWWFAYRYVLEEKREVL